MRDIVLGCLVRNLDVGGVVEIGKVCDLVPVTVAGKTNAGQVVFRENVMLVDSILRSAGTQDEILGYWGVAEQHRSIQHDLSCHISIPRRRNSRSAVQLVR